MSSESKEFQAEVQQLLDIVIHSLYTDKEIFVRELVSNASDALEKFRHRQLTEKDVFDDNLPLEINITTDDTAKTITIADYGIGMTREELIENIGTIAHSGSKEFLKALDESAQKESALIGQFGVGFYSAFMVAKQVRVYSHSWREDGEHLLWTSDGTTSYTIEEAPGQRRGCKIVIDLKEECEEFATKSRIEELLKTYSNFVPFPINLNGEHINTIDAVWLKSKKEVSKEEYAEFYKFSGKAWDEPRYTFHFQADAPLEINSLLFVPTQNKEKMFGPGNLEPSVSLYCQKVLIDAQPKGLLPEWLRFLVGVVDSSDLPLNISRESMQDSSLVRKLNRTITSRFLKFLDREAKSDGDSYEEFYQEFSRFIKEGICVDHEHQQALAKLLRFESSMDEGLTSLPDYLSRSKAEQDAIYYQVGESRSAIEAGPYLEAFQARGLEVAFFYESIDDYLITNLREYEGKKLIPVDRADLDLGDLVSESDDPALAQDELEKLEAFLKECLGDRVEEVAAGTRLVSSPAAALNPDEHTSPQLREMMKSLHPDQEAGAVKVKLEINPRHGLIKELSAAHESRPDAAKLIAFQILDQALLSAGLLEKKTDLVDRGYQIMAEALKSSSV